YINYEDLKRLVNQLGNRYGTGTGVEAPTAARPVGKKKDKEEGIRRSERLLLTWLIEEPDLFKKIEGIIEPVDFVKPLYRQAAEMVFESHKKGAINPAAILNHFIDDEGNQQEVAALFNASLEESLSNAEQKKAFADTVLKIKKNSLDFQSRNAKDLSELQTIIKEQAELANLHISLD
ncbi:MAG: DNA primase, partial [Clostridium sp.]